MLSEQNERAIRRVLEYHTRGMFTDPEIVSMLGMTLRDCDLGQVLAAVPEEHHPTIRASHIAALERIADTDCLHPERSPFDQITRGSRDQVADLLLEVSDTAPRNYLPVVVIVG